MSRLSRFMLRVPRPKSLFGFIGLQTGTEVIALALVFNKVVGLYGLLAILTGYQLSLLQFSTYVYSIAILGLLAIFIPHIRRQSPFECLALAWVYTLDTAVNAVVTGAFGLDWYFASQLSTTPGATAEGTIPEIVEQGMEGLRHETTVHGKVVPQETATSMLLILATILIRVYFCLVMAAYAKQILQKYTQLLILEDVAVDELHGPFSHDLPDGDGRRGSLGRLMVSVGRGYWLDQRDAEEWAHGNVHPGKSGATGPLLSEV